MPEPIYVDNTILSAVARCDMKAWLRHVQHRTSVDESAALKCGTAAHEALAHWLKHDDVPSAMVRFEELYNEWGHANVVKGDGWHPDVAYDCLATFMATHPIETLPFRVPDTEFVEAGFAYPLDEHGDYMYVGRLDAAARDAVTGMWLVVDWKTTKRLTSEKVRSYTLDSQMMGYTWVLENLVGPQDMVGVILGLIEMKAPPAIKYKKDGKAYKCPTHRGLGFDECQQFHYTSEFGSVTYSHRQIEDWHRTALFLAQKYEALLTGDPGYLTEGGVPRQQGFWNGSCNWCEFNRYCDQGRSQLVIEADYKVEEWKPWQY